MNPDWKPLIPMRLIAPIIEEWAARNRMTTIVEGYFGAEHDQLGGELEALAERSGVTIRRISDIRRGFSTNRSRAGKAPGRHTIKGYNTSFQTADKLLCAMDRVQHWHHGELKKLYKDIPVASWEKHREGNE